MIIDRMEENEGHIEIGRRKERIKDEFKGHVLGYCYRQKVVHKVRTTYEQVVSEIQPQNDFSFADEVVDWPSEVELCYPVFQDIKNVVEGTGIRDTPHDKVHGNKAALHRDCRCAGNLMAPQVNQVVEGGLVFDRDRESLLEIRSKLGMELVWLKQAITSRQKYLHLKRKLEEEPFPSRPD